MPPFRRIMLRALLAASALTALALPAHVTAQDEPEVPAGRRLVIRRFSAPLTVAPSVLYPRFLNPRPVTDDHPLFHSLYMGEPGRTVARTAFGPVTARDLYLYLLLRDDDAVPPYILELYDEARTQSERTRLARIISQAIDEYVFDNHIAPGLAPDVVTDPLCALKSYIHELKAWQLVYILEVVRPRIILVEADRQKFLQENARWIAEPERRRIRYIYLPSPGEADIEEEQRLEGQLRKARENVLTGISRFSDEATSISQAPSASNGGEIPPIRRGELFFLLEEAAFRLDPGEVSEVIRTPHGLYLLEVIEALPAEEPSLSNPRHAAKVDDGLLLQVLRARYRADCIELFEKRRPVTRHIPWDEREPDDVVGRVHDFTITKAQFQALYPEIEDEDLESRGDLIVAGLRGILERESMAQAVREEGRDHSQLIDAARRISANLVARDYYLMFLEQNLRVTEADVRKFWRENPRLFTPLPMKRIVKLNLSPVTIIPDPDEVADALTGVLAGASAFLRGEGETLERPGGERRNAEPVDLPPMTYTPVQDPALWTDPRTYAAQPGTRGQTRVPLLPLDRDVPLEASRLQDFVQDYASSDFILRYEDLGFYYIEDRSDLPPELAKLSPGQFTQPEIRRAAAFAYIVEDERRLAKPPFDEIESHAYFMYRRKNVERKFERDYRAGLARAAIRTTF